MDVYLVPVDKDRYELYCEVPDEPDDHPGEERRGFIRRMIGHFREMVAEAERERRHGTPGPAPRGWFGRMRARMLRWVVETMAEQRLLWHLRQQQDVCLHYPDDMDQPTAARILRAQLGHDSDKHRRWMIVDGLGLLLSVVVLGPLFLLVPGVANLPAFYFGFRVIGHYFSWRGATQGLHRVEWRHSQSAPLTELRRVLALDPQLREPRVHAVAETLRLEHLASFFQRTAVSA